MNKKQLTSYDLFMQKKYDNFINKAKKPKSRTLGNQNVDKGVAKVLKSEVNKMSLDVKKGSYKEIVED